MMIIINHFIYFSNTHKLSLMGTLSKTVHCFLVLLKRENPNLFYAWFLWVEEWPGLYMLWNQFTAHLGDFLPLPQNGQGQLLFMVFTTFYGLKKSFLKILYISNDFFTMLHDN